MRYVSRFKVFVYAAAVVAVAFVITVGCASTQLRTEASTSGIRGAEEAGAEGVPQAALHLQLAKEELAAAKALHEKGDKEEADSMLLRAEADSELAIALSRGDAERIEAEQAMARVHQLHKDNQ